MLEKLEWVGCRLNPNDAWVKFPYVNKADAAFPVTTHIFDEIGGGTGGGPT
jgi:hypothetical protein